MQHFKKIFFLLAVLFSTQVLLAQKKPASKSTITTFKKIKPPKLQTFLDVYKDSVGVPLSVAEKIIGLPLKIYDDKKVEYAISSYQFLYRKLGVTEDAEGKAIPATSISTERFKIAPIPELWINLIRQQLKAGEEFYFFEVIAKDAQGRVMYAPDLKITIQ